MTKFKSCALLMISSLVYSAPTFATLFNGGIYIPDNTAKYGETISLNGAIASDKDESNVTVTIGIHSVSAAGVISTTPVFSKVFAQQNFLKGKSLSYNVSYAVPDSIITGKYAMVMMAGTAANDASLLRAQGIAAPYALNLEGKPVPVVTNPATKPNFYNAGVYVATPTVNAGSSMKANIGIAASTNVSGATVQLEVHAVSATGAVSSTALVKKEYTNVSFVANQAKSYNDVLYAIPAGTTSGKYILTANVLSSANEVYFNYQPVSSVNSFTVNGSAVVVTPPVVTPPVVTPPVVTPPVTTPSNSDAIIQVAGGYTHSKSVNAGSTINATLGFVSDKAVSGLTVNFEIHKVNDSGAIESAVIASKSYTNVSLVAGQSQEYKDMSFAIPSSAASGTYTLTAVISDSSKTFLTYNAINDYTAFAVVNPSSPVVVTPTTPPIVDTSPVTFPTDDGKFLRGINIMDLGQGDSVLPGTFGQHYTAPNLEALTALKQRKMNVLRLPFKWERIQPTLNGPLDTVYLGRLLQVMRDVNSLGMKAIIDMHNYGRYVKNGVTTKFGDSNGPTQAQYQDAWKKIAMAVKADSAAYNALYAYDLMNEPYDLPAVNGSGAKNWEGYAQAAVNAIRSTNDTKMIHVEGYNFSSASAWSGNHPAKFITDSANNIMYHAHMYLDNNTSGAYDSNFAAETSYAKSQGHASVGARGIARLKVFSNWCAAQQVKCFLGEFGWPNSAHVGASAGQEWNNAGEELMSYMDSIKMGGTMWATGSWMGETTNILNAYVLPGQNYQKFNALNQSDVLERHLGN